MVQSTSLRLVPESNFSTQYRTAATPPVTDKVYYVSKSGSDSNDGLTRQTAFLTVGASLGKVGTSAKLIVGWGTFNESNLNPPNGTHIEGMSTTGTFIQLTVDNGTLMAAVNMQYATFEHIQFQFSSAVNTGTLISLSNSFGNRFNDCRFLGTYNGASSLTAYTGQLGLLFTGNSGDNYFRACMITAFGVGVQPDAVINYLTDCRITNNKVGIQAGDPTTTNLPGGIVCTACVFVGGSAGNDSFVNITGRSGAWTFDGCWWDGQATDGIIVGSTTHVNGAINGPRMISIVNSPYLTGRVRSLTLNEAGTVNIDGVLFGNNGTNPVDLTIPNPAYAAARMATWGAFYSTQNGSIQTTIPQSWRTSGGTAGSTDIQVFTSTGTWTKPSSATTVRAFVRAPGGGGGSGRRGAAGSIRGGGCGGGGGGYSFAEFSAASLSATVTATIGTTGAGGAAVTTDDTNGNAGTGGGTTTFGSYLRTVGGGGGAGGTNGAIGAVGAGGAAAWFGNNGGSPSATGTAGGNGVTTNQGGIGGGAGGGITAADVASAGGSSFDPNDKPGAATYGGGAAGGTAGTAGTDRLTGEAVAGPGGGGGGATITASTTGGAGGNAGKYGGGGGGGGASLNGLASGAGGNGAPGIIVVISS